MSENTAAWTWICPDENRFSDMPSRVRSEAEPRMLVAMRNPGLRFAPGLGKAGRVCIACAIVGKQVQVNGGPAAV